MQFIAGAIYKVEWVDPMPGELFMRYQCLENDWHICMEINPETLRDIRTIRINTQSQNYKYTQVASIDCYHKFEVKQLFTSIYQQCVKCKETR